ncbi:MAG: hypothetical protein GY798_28810 [Hyphomicrobiales bacterium]|nr:hypothetical protein [Hyphomicrobiales bacterium]
MTTRIRKIFVAAAFVATAAAGITGATLSGESKETDLAAICDTAVWPNIPTECLEGETDSAVRHVSVYDASEAETFVLQTVAILPSHQFVEQF